MIQKNPDETKLDSSILGMVKDGTDELRQLQTLCRFLYAIHYLAGQQNLPLEHAYAAMLTEGTFSDTIKDGKAIERILNAHKAGKLKNPHSPIAALMERIDTVKREMLTAQRSVNAPRYGGAQPIE